MGDTEATDGEGEESPDDIERPTLKAWNVTNNVGETQRIIVGKHFNHDQRIEIDPDDLIEDPDVEQ